MEIMATMPSEALIILYAIALYHEKYIFAKWVMEELSKRGILKKDMKDFDKNFKGFYKDLLTQENL